MRRNELTSIQSAYDNIITEARKRWSYDDVKLVSRGLPTVDQVKSKLLELSHMVSWEEFVLSQKPGECPLIAKSVSKMFPKIEMYSVVISFSQQAIDKMEPQTDPDMYTCTHYLNKVGDLWIDFGKGTNRYEGIYVLDGIDDLMSVVYSNDAKSHFSEIFKKDPKSIWIDV